MKKPDLRDLDRRFPGIDDPFPSKKTKKHVRQIGEGAVGAFSAYPPSLRANEDFNERAAWRWGRDKAVRLLLETAWAFARSTMPAGPLEVAGRASFDKLAAHMAGWKPAKKAPTKKVRKR